MKKLFFLFAVLIMSKAFSSELEGQYLCKKGFLGPFVVDTLTIQTAKSGNFYIMMNDRDFKLTPDCKISDKKIQASCSENFDQVVLTKTEPDYKTTVVTKLTFSKLNSMVIVREEESSGYGNDLTILVCRPLKK